MQNKAVFFIVISVNPVKSIQEGIKRREEETELDRNKFAKNRRINIRH